MIRYSGFRRFQARQRIDGRDELARIDGFGQVRLEPRIQRSDAAYSLSGYATKRRVTRADIAALVDVAINDTCHQTNPRPCTREDFERIFTAAM